MKCPSCGAEIGTSKVCEFCGSTISAEMQREAEQLRKEGCPKCGSSNITFRRENQGEIRGKNQKAVIHRTVGLCKDCGYTWYPNSAEAPKAKRKTWLWVLGWICIFPIPLTLIMLKKDTKPALKYGIIAAAWIVYLLIGIFGGGSEQSEKGSATETANQPVVEEIQDETAEDNGVDTSNNTSPNQNDSQDIKVEDSIVDLFINEYNDAYGEKIIDIKKGNIRTKYYGYIKDTRIEMINANDAAAECFVVKIYGGNEDSDRDSMFETFKGIAKILEPSLSDEEIVSAIDELIAGDILIEDYKLGDSLSLTYVPSKELSYGKNDCRLDVNAYNYNGKKDDTKTTSEQFETNSLQALFASLNTSTTRDEIDDYINQNNLEKYAFTGDSGYQIGYDKAAIRKRGRDRVGEAVDINFNNDGTVKSANYAVHTESSTHYSLKYENGIFYYENQECASGSEAMQKYLQANN